MPSKFQQLERALGTYHQLQEQFAALCKNMDEGLNKNPHLPGISFSAEPDGRQAKLNLLGQTFIIRFAALWTVRTQLGVLAAFVPAPNNQEKLLWRTYFDDNGAVRTAPNSGDSTGNIFDKEFVKVFLGEITAKYFTRPLEEVK